MSRSIFPLFFTSFLLFSSCSDESNFPPDTPNSNFSKIINFEVGNYWVFERNSFDVNDQLVFSDLDTLQILRDSVISGRKIYIFNKAFGFSGSEMLYDSLDYLKTYPNNLVVFTTDSNFRDTFSNLVSTGNAQYLGDSIRVVVPFASLTTHLYQTRSNPIDPNIPGGTRYANIHFTEDIGIVKWDAQYFISGNRIVMSLKSIGD